MRLIKIAAAVLNQTPLAWGPNRANILAAIAAARRDGARLLCLPEMCIPGYGCEDVFHSMSLQATSLDILAEVADATESMIVSVGLPIAFQGALYNAAALVADGRVRGFVCKRFLAGDGIYYEPRWFKPWPSGVTAEITVLGHALPIGDLHFDCGGVRIGFEICEDAWVAKRPGTASSLAAADVILNPSASHFAFGKFEVRRRLVLEGSRAFGVAYVYANLLGNDAGRIVYDGGALIASGGTLLAAGPRLSFHDTIVTSAVVDLDKNRSARARQSSFEADPAHANDGVVRVEFGPPEAAPEWPEPSFAPWETSAHIKAEEFARAEALALFDYLRKSRAHGFVVSLSGGADSAAVSCLVSLMVRMAIADLGLEGLRGKLGYIPGLRDLADAKAIVGRLLTTAYQATAQSGEVTRAAARGIAEALGATHLELDVEALVKGYVALIEQAIGRDLTWKDDDLALQNIQARVRSPGIWMIANLKRSLLLATSNRSEAAVGYATMDGDTSGGLSPIAGLDKAYLRKWLRWLEHEGPIGYGPIPALDAINVQAPTAELQPAAMHQTDEADLMPYEILDLVERLAIRDKLAPVDVWRMLKARFTSHDARQLAQWVERFFRLWCINQWKRERYAPSFHLDDENLDPKTWCRFPILSGGFEWELEALRRAVEEVA